MSKKIRDIIEARSDLFIELAQSIAEGYSYKVNKYELIKEAAEELAYRLGEEF